ncbi:hypothetical protein BC826DRAFT_1105754 [Russula brevipes]|nr:hypothetical protein BC826DRAFT_1105754 [Russula brevipes]
MRPERDWAVGGFPFFIRHPQETTSTSGHFHSPVSLWPGSGDTGLAKVRQTFNISSDMHMTFNPIVVLLGVTLPQPDATTGDPPLVTIQTNQCPGAFIVAAVNLDAPTPQSRNLTQVRHFLGGSFQLVALCDRQLSRIARLIKDQNGSKPHSFQATESSAKE